MTHRLTHKGPTGKKMLKIAELILEEANQLEEETFLLKLNLEVRKAEEFAAEYMASKKAKEVK